MQIFQVLDISMTYIDRIQGCTYCWWIAPICNEAVQHAFEYVMVENAHPFNCQSLHQSVPYECLKRRNTCPAVNERSFSQSVRGTNGQATHCLVDFSDFYPTSLWEVWLLTYSHSLLRLLYTLAIFSPFDIAFLLPSLSQRCFFMVSEHT